MIPHKTSMKAASFFLCVFFSAFGLQVCSTHAQTGTPAALPLGPDGLILNSDNLHPPYMAVYRWDVSGVKNGEHDAYATWLNRADVWPESHQAKDTWESAEGPGWQLRPWGEWMAKHPRARFVYSVSILPGKWDGSGPATGFGAGIPVSLAQGAKGTYNPHYKKLAGNLVKAGLGNAILRLGWEFNGGWMQWKVTNQAQADAFAEYWRQIVNTMRAVPGAEKLNFCWNPNLGHQAYPCDKAWPGDEYVDNIGIDIYDDAYDKDTYPWPEDAAPEEIETRRHRAWDNFYQGSYGLLWFRKFAAAHKKPLSIPEWGVNHKPDKHGGLDNPYFVEQMHKFIQDPANNVEWHCYFDVQAGDGGHQLSPGLKNKPTQFPKSAELFHKYFAMPATRPAMLPAN